MRQEGRTYAEEGGARTLQDQCGVGDAVWTPERWSQRKKGRDEYKATQRQQSKKRLGYGSVCVFMVAIMSAVGPLVLLTQCSSMQMVEPVQALVKRGS